MMTRSELLHAAEVCVCGQREGDYGSPEDNFRVIGELWGTYIKAKCVAAPADVCINPEDVAALMGLLKIARIASGRGKDDNWTDLAGYAACGGELESRFEMRPEATYCDDGHEWEAVCAQDGAIQYRCGRCGEEIRESPKAPVKVDVPVWVKEETI